MQMPQLPCKVLMFLWVSLLLQTEWVQAKNVSNSGSNSVGSGTTCNDGIGTPFPLYQFLNNPNQCDPGFYCPNLVASDNNTWPTICPPSTSCQLNRLQFLFCPAQGLYDPIVCPEGYYCPDYLHKYICPEGSYCPVGRFEPITCPPLSSCPEGSGSLNNQYYGSLVWILLFDVFIGISIYLYHRNEKTINLNRSNAYRNLEGLSATMNFNKDSKLARLPLYTQILCLGFERARHDHMLNELKLGHLTSDDLSNDEKLYRHRYLTFQFNNLSLAIPSTEKGKASKVILSGVTGTIKPGTVTAIMGPSGAGKTTFLNTMMGKVDSSWARGGELIINGKQEELTKYKNIVGYVPQEDIMLRELTVYQNIKYSADIRLPRSWTERQRNKHTQAVISALQLSHVHGSKIGDENERGISGGQRKRVNIGMELACAPAALFLDEPTSGLDSTAALEVCRVLKDIAQNTNLTVAMVIHQPRLEIWNSLDQLLLLAPGGKTVYEGPQRLCQSYFVNHIGIILKPQDNPADVIMDAIGSEGEAYVKAWATEGPAILSRLNAAFHIDSKKLSLDKFLHQKESVQANDTNANDKNRVNNDDNKDEDQNKGQKEEDNVEMMEIDGNKKDNNNNNNNNNEEDNKVDTGVVISDDKHFSYGVDDDDNVNEEDLYDDIPNNNTNNKSIDNKIDVVPQPFEKEKLVLDNKSHERGASFLRQIYLVHNRNIVQQISKINNLFIEIFIGGLAGLIMGFAAYGTYQGILISPYTLLSPSSMEWTIPQIGMFICMSISIAAASAGVRVFHEEQIVLWRETANGNNTLAYFIGVSIASLYRQFFDALHFSFIYHILAKPMISFPTLLLLVFLQFCGTYGIGSIVSQVTTRENGGLVAVVIALIMSVFNGYAGLPYFLQVLTPGYFMTEAMFGIYTNPFSHLMQVYCLI